jgi:hypothetical protein
MTPRFALFASVSLLAFCVNAATYYVDASRPDDAGAATNWTTAKKSIQSAINLATTNDTVLVTNGTYACISSGSKAITIQSVNGAEATIIDGANANTCANLSSSLITYDTVLRGFTLRNGYASRGGGSRYGTLYDCILSSNRATDGGGGAYFGALYNCTLINNKARDTQGSGLNGYGGGAYNCMLYNCLVQGNNGGRGGGVYGQDYIDILSSYPTIFNCTVVSNTSDYGGGVYGWTSDAGLTVKNSIIWGNTAQYNSALDNYSACVFFYSCTTPLPAGLNNIAQNPLFVNASNGNYRLLWDSPCVDVGNNSYISSTTNDLAGNARIQNGTVEMGAYEGGITSIEPVIMSPPSGTLRTNSVAVTIMCQTWGSTIYYTTNDLAPTTNDTMYTGVFILSQNTTVKAKAFRTGMTGDLATANYTVIQTVSTPTISPVSGTTFSNSLEISINCTTESATIRYTLDGSPPNTDSILYTNAFTITKSTTVKTKAFKTGMADSAIATASYRSSIFYVDASRPDDSGDGYSWATAKMTIQAAVNTALDGDTVLVTNGTYNIGTTVTPGYALSNRVVITNNVTVRSLNGPAVTIIGGSGAASYGTDSAIRCVYMSKGRLEGFTLQNGATLSYSTGAIQNLSGGGVHVSSTATDVALSNCIIRECKAKYGGGSHYGTLNNCTLSGNTAYFYSYNESNPNASGGGSYYGTLNNCTLSGNMVYVLTSGPGVNTTITSYGGGSYYGTLNNCALSNNTALGMSTPSDNKGSVLSYGGGSYAGTLNNCTLSGNAAISYASFTSPSYNALSFGGGSYESTVKNCTVTKNTANAHNSLGISRSDGGGLYNSTVQNCIVWHNSAAGIGNNYNLASSRPIVFTCSTPLPPGIGNIAIDPQFVDGASGDIRLRPGSPCLDAGANEYSLLPTDISGSPRVLNGTVDMGAYEGPVTGNLIDVRIRGAGTVTPANVQVVPNGSAVAFTAQFTARPFIGFLTNGVFATAETNFVWKGIGTNGELTAVFETRTWHVNAARIDDTGDGLSWSAAKKTIQNAVDLALAGDTVLVTNGTYNVGSTTTPNFSLRNRVVITKNIIVKSVNGPNTTIITGSGTSAYGTPSAIRCVFMSDGILDGFTLQDGATYSPTQSGEEYDTSGGGLCACNATSDSVILNCIIRQCKAANGGGSFNNTLSNCSLTGNTAAEGNGGGTFWGTLNNCKLSGNTAAISGGGAYQSTLNNCTLSGNVATSNGGGSSYGTLNNCTLTGNSTTSGGGAYYGVLNNCVLTGNRASSNGGGSNYGTLNNCTVTANTSPSGVYNSLLNNCVVWENRQTNGVIANHTGMTASYTCTAPLPSGLGNISIDPLFCATNDFRLQLNSPCINNGNNALVTLSTDVLGSPRIQGGIVDMGAYEGVGVLADPTFSPTSDTTRTNSISVALFCATASATIRYTIDTSEPTLDSAAFLNAFTLTNTATVKAKAFKSGMIESATATASYTVIQTVATPSFSPLTGGTSTNSLEITLSCATEDAVIRYSTDGSTPTADSPEYTHAFTIAQSATVKAKAFKSGMADSVLATATYTVYADAPAVDPPSGTVTTNSLTFTLNCTTENAEIRYTINGVEPTITSTLYTNPVFLNQSATVKAKAYKPGLTNSTTATATYTVVQPVATPTLSPASGTTGTNALAITINCATAGSAIRYTLDGSEPTGTNTLYSGSITLTQSATVNARAFKAGMADSGTATATFVIVPSTASPTFSPVSGTSFSNSLLVTVSSATEGATIRYTTDGSTPSTDSPVYTDAITLTKTTTIKGKAFKASMGDSATVSATYRSTMLYVDGARPDDTGDGSSWATAKQTIQAAVTVAAAGDTVLVTNGIYNVGASVTPGYSVSNRVVINKAITVRSVNGAESTIIEGSGFTAYGTPGAIRCVYMTNGVLDGFTLRHGATFDTAQSTSAYNNGGGGICMNGAAAGTEVRNCIIQNCKAYSGGAVYQGTLTNCVLNQNWSSMNGGGSYTGTLLDCVISANSAGGSGGGSYQSVLIGCNLIGNTAGTSGGGSYEGSLTECRLSDNVATSNGGGSYYGTISRCAYSGNSSASGGGSYYGTLNNCTFSRNAANTGGGAYYGTLDNCTLSANTATIGGGSYNGTYYNCIVWGNTIPNGSTNNYSGGTFRHTCTTPMIAGLGNIATDPLLVNADDLRIRNGSPCLNSGNNAYGTGSLDILNHPRIQDSIVDMGAYEGGVSDVTMPVFEPASGTVFTNSLTVTLTKSMTGATIRYTLDGNVPTTNSQEYTSAFDLSESTTVKAKAFKPGLAESLTATATYTKLETIVTPEFNPASGAVRTNSVSVALTCATPSTTLRYTLDGTDPSAESVAYTNVLILTQSTTVRVKAFKTGMIDSATASADYTVVQTVASPIISPATGTIFSNSLVITLNCATADAVIRYTLDGSIPTSGSTLYSKPVKVSRNTVIRVGAFKAGMLDSVIVEARFFKELTLAEAVDVTNLVFTTGGNASWEGMSLTNAHDTVDAAQSGSVTDSQLSWMETTVIGSGTLSFWWKASCEDDPDADNWDFVRFLVDGVERYRLDGITNWRLINCTLGEGTHVLRWEYSKDESLSEGEDRVWVDQLLFVQGATPPAETITTPVPVPYAWLDQYPILLTLSGGAYEDAANADIDGDGHMAWEEYVTGSIPTNRLSVLLTHIAFSNELPWITWSPDIGTSRVYTVNGKSNLADPVWGPTNSSSRFFKVKVDMHQ